MANVPGSGLGWFVLICTEQVLVRRSEVAKNLRFLSRATSLPRLSSFRASSRTDQPIISVSRSTRAASLILSTVIRLDAFDRS